MKRYLLIAAAVIAAVTAAAVSFADGYVDEYSATLVHVDRNLEDISKVYVSGGDCRIEPEQSYQPIIIAKKDDGITYTIDRNARTYTKDDYRAEDLPPILAPASSKNRANVGEATVDGKKCIKAEITYDDRYGKEKKEYRYYDMYTRRLLKVESEDGEWSYTLKDVRVGRQDDTLFEPPSDYTSY